ncbi:MAG: peptidylprolyl isomerase [Verrucomicrobiota bacterium]|jgi:peptidyl-prolyl cis-trans isomerase C
MNSFVKGPALPATLALSLLALVFHARAAAPDNTNGLFADAIVATGKGFEIKRSQLNEAYLNYSANIAARGGTVEESERATIRSNLLDHLIINQILLQKATDEDRSKTQVMVDQAIADARSNAPSPAAFEAQIKASGMTLEKMRKQALDEQVCRQVILRETTNDITISEADIKKFYDDHPSEFEVPERVHAAHILVSTLDPATHSLLPPEQKKEKEKLANELRGRAEKGEDFSALVKQYSDDPGSKNKGGEYTFARGKMVPEFEAAAFSLKTNQISDLVETQYGYHIIKLLEKLPASKVTLAEASPRIRDYLIGQGVKKGLPAYMAKLKAAADVKILDEGGSQPPADKK